MATARVSNEGQTTELDNPPASLKSPLWQHFAFAMETMNTLLTKKLQFVFYSIHAGTIRCLRQQKVQQKEEGSSGFLQVRKLLFVFCVLY